MVCLDPNKEDFNICIIPCRFNDLNSASPYALHLKNHVYDALASIYYKGLNILVAPGIA